MTDERRRFTRINFDANAEIDFDGQCYAVHLHDLSLKGALIHSDLALPCSLGDSLVLYVHLADNSISLKFPCTMSHTEDHNIGLKFGVIDLDTLTHLRRLVELNIGDSLLLERELEHLFDQHNASQS